MPNRRKIVCLLLLQRGIIPAEASLDQIDHVTQLITMPKGGHDDVKEPVPASLRGAIDAESGHVFHNGEGENQVEANSIDQKYCPQDNSIPWLQFVGITTLLNLAFYSPSIFTTRIESQYMGRTTKFLFSIAAASFILIAPPWKILPYAAILMMEEEASTNASQTILCRVGLMTFCGFLVPIMISSACRDSTYGRNRINGDHITNNCDEDSDQLTAMDCPSFGESCRRGFNVGGDEEEHTPFVPPHLITIRKDDQYTHQASDHSRKGRDEDEHTPFVPPHLITIRKDDQYTHQASDHSRKGLEIPARHCVGKSYNTKIRHIYLFIHGAFIGTSSASILCSCGETFVIVSAIALFHGMYLEQLASDTTNERSWLSRSILPLGGMAVAVLIIEQIADRDMNVVSAILAVAGGLYINVSLGMIFTIRSLASADAAQHGEFYRSGSRDTLAGHYRKRIRRAIDRKYRNQLLKHEYCMPYNDDSDLSILTTMQCQITPSASRAIPVPKHATKPHVELESNSSRQYDKATWNMYARIVTARQARVKCGICFGSMEKNDSRCVAVGEASKAASTTKQKVDRKVSTASMCKEDQRLMETCPSPLHYESFHQECYSHYGAIEKNNSSCPHRDMLMSEDNMIFQLDF